jgi:hypothetical protein
MPTAMMRRIEALGQRYLALNAAALLAGRRCGWPVAPGSPRRGSRVASKDANSRETAGGEEMPMEWA